MSTLKSRPFLILIAGFLVLFIGGGARLTIGLTLRPMVEELGWGRSELGVTVAVFQVVTAIAMFYAGKIADTMSLRLVLGGGVALGGVTIGAMCVAVWLEDSSAGSFAERYLDVLREETEALRPQLL